MGNKIDTILIGFAESLSAPEVAWDLLAHGFKVIAFCRRGSCPPLRRIKEIKLFEVTPPEVDAWETIEQIRIAIQVAEAKTFMPLDDGSIWLCDRVSALVDVPLAGASGETARLALDKKFQLDEAKAAGFNIPETDFVTDRNDLTKIRHLPAVIKPALAVTEANGKLSRGPITFCIDRDDVNRAVDKYKNVGPMIVQPVLEGIGEGIFGLNGPEGVKKWSFHRRIRMINPLGSGSSACRSMEIDDQPIQSAERMLKKNKWPAMFMVELLRDPAGRLWFMELNGRSWGSMALAIRLGLHYPAWTVMQTLDKSFVPPDTPPWKPLVCRHIGREIIHALAVLKGKKAYQLIPNYSRMRTLSEVLRFSRNEAWYNWNPDCSLLFWEDTIRTVMGKIFSRWGSN